MRHFQYKTLSELRRSAEALGATHVRFEDDPQKVREILTRRVQVGSRCAGNSMAIHPMEGCDGELDGRPGELTWRRYERFGRGGAKLIWFEATAVREDGRANTRQLWITKNNVGDFRRLLEKMLSVHREEFGSNDDVIVPLQLTHSGRYSVPKRIIAYHNPLIDRKTNVPSDYPVISDDELERLEDDFVAAAGLAIEAGFRAIDIKATHGYLLSELLGAKTREGRYGGSLENRTRIIRNIMGKIRAKYGRELMLCMRLGCFDGIPYGRDEATGIGVPFEYPVPYLYGWGVDPNDPLKDDLTEVKQAIAWFREWGLELLNVSLGCPYYNPHIGRPFEKPDDGNYEQPEHPLHGVDRHFRIAGELQQSFPDLPMVGTGYSWLQKYCINAAARKIDEGAIRFFGIGRGALAYPDFARAVMERGELDERRVCKTLTYCTWLMRRKDHPLGQWPTGCPPFDKEVYGPVMKEARGLLRLQATGKG
ncbi:MAG: NADH:flavin oxidoreductase [Bryobacteraceae bacterium]|nr:NADH:flavin oxidoreductase [Bryobacteraceae bacterium]